MTIQDYMVQQMVHKAKAEMAFNQGDYYQAAENILSFAEGCAGAKDVFNSEKDPKVIHVAMIGYNNAALMMCKILELTAGEINDPVDDNPYRSGRTLDDDPDVPESVAKLALGVCILAANYTDIAFNMESSTNFAIGLLSSIMQVASAGFYYSEFEDNDISECKRLIEKSEKIAEMLVEKFPDDTNIVSLVKNYYILVGMFCLHYSKVSSDDALIDWQLKGTELCSKSFAL